MMKKNLSVAVVLAVLLTLAVGYALFSQTINITGTATAQGSFSYTIDVQKELNSEIDSNNLYEVYDNYGSTGADYYDDLTSTQGLTSSISNSGNNVTYSVAFTEPGQNQYFTVKVTNTGTIPMSIDYYNLLSGVNPTMSGTITGRSGTVYQYNELNSCLHGECADNFISNDKSFAEGGVRNTIAYVFAPQSIYLQIEDAGDYIPVVLNTNESIYFVIKTKLADDIGSNSKIKGFNLTASYNVNLVFNQATN